VDGLDGRYNWHEDTDSEAAEFFAGLGSLDYRPDGRTAVAYIGIHERRGEAVGKVGVRVSELSDGVGTG
jgi:hypothetical protein